MPKVIPNEAPIKHYEKVIFDQLIRSPRARKWTVFHSKLLEDSVKFGGPCEIDFVIFIPDPYYTVICLEVKDGSFEIDENNQWWRTNYPRESVSSPTEQAQNAMSALNRFAPSYFGPLTLGCAVAVSGTAANPPKGTLVINQTDILGDSLTTRLENYACQKRKKLGPPKKLLDTDAHKALKELQNKLGNTDMSEKRDIIRYDLDTYHQEFLSLTANQLAILTQVRENDRGVIYGAAGTGKTILAMELAKELGGASENGAKKTVALLCSNPYLGYRLEKWAKNIDGVEAGTPLTLPAKVPALEKNYRNILSKYPTLEESLNPEYKAAEWGAFIRDMINVKEEGKKNFDYLIVDEAQNLYDEVFLELMNALLEEGLANGKWRLFGDFENQNIVDLQFDGDWKKILKESLENQKVKNFSYFRLAINCRSTQEIAEAFSIFLDNKNLPPPMNGVHGPDFEIKYFQSTQDKDISEEDKKLPTLEELMNDLVSDFEKRGFSSEQMVLLFTGDRNNLGIDTQRKYGDCALLDIRDVEKESLTEVERVIVTSSSPSNKLRYSTVYDFQGLESELVFLVLSVTDDMMVAGGSVVFFHPKYLSRLLYTGMSRAKTMLVIVVDKSYKIHIDELI